MANEKACRDRDMALAILRTITEPMKVGTQRVALESVAEWLQGNRTFDKIPSDHEERKTLIKKIKMDLRSCMTNEQRKAEAAFYLEGIRA